MKIAIANDHRGTTAKQRLSALMRHNGHEVHDLGAQTGDSVDYPDYAFQVAEAVGLGQMDRGILVCGSGIGMCIAANKVPGARAALCSDPQTAEMSRRHNDANVLCLSADMMTADLMDRTVLTWLASAFEGGRHARRVDKIRQYEGTLPADSAGATPTNVSNG